MRKLLFALAIAPLLHAETGAFTIHMILHAIGEERYEIVPNDSGLRLNTTFEISDRGNKRTTTAELRMKADGTPLSLKTSARPEADVALDGSPQAGFIIRGSSPFAIQMAMMRYWMKHGRPALLPNVLGPIQIQETGKDTIKVDGHSVPLTRYTVANLMFGREIVWMNGTGDLAAAMTFAGGLPMEAVRTEYEPALMQLYGSGVAQEMADLDSLTRAVPPDHTGAFAITGARLMDGTQDSVVIVRNGRIAAVGPRATVTVPRGMAIIDAAGKTLLPGLWEMHTHFSGVEFGPALLGTGITTARDCGGEFDYLVAQRDAVEKHNALGPRLLLAGLVDAGGLKAFGHVTAETADEGRAVVNRYHAAGFQQIKLYTFLEPDVIRAITAEAHRLGMTVTGHVPKVFDAYQGIEAGMDQINHLNYVSTIMREPGRPDKAIQFLKEHHTVVDPTAGWGEMASHSKEVNVESFEPGIAHAPFVLDVKFRGMGSNATAAQMQSRQANTLATIGALHKAGIPIIPGSDTGLVGYGLLRELELYVEAGMTPLEAVQSATIVSARAMNLDKDTGSIEQGKRADLILVDGNPLEDIRSLRNVSHVVTNGRMFDTAKLRQSVGFH